LGAAGRLLHGVKTGNPADAYRSTTERRLLIMSTDIAEATRETEAIFARRMEVVTKMFAGEASYDDVLAFHSEDFIWLSPASTIRGHDAAKEYAARRMSRIPANAMEGMEILQTKVIGEYAFLTFKTDLIPFGTDTFRIRDGNVVFQSNAMYIPREYRDAMNLRESGQHRR
jgi:hypothetical protein